MIINNFEKILIRPNLSLIGALEALRNSGKKCLIIVDKNKKLLGTLTDGDLRTIIISGQKLNKSIKKYYNKKPKFIYRDQYFPDDVKNEFLKGKYELIPIVSKSRKVIDVITWDQAFESNKNDNIKNTLNKIKVIIMAGGLGQRLKPFTSILPKALIPINNKSVLEHILESFQIYGVKNFIISLNYKSKIIKSYCEEIKNKFNLKFLIEKKPLGTVGSLKLFKINNNKAIFITNSDIIVKSDFIDMYNFHIQKKNDLTIIVAAKKFTIPYGVCKTTKEGILSKIDEKPKQEVLINTGLYILNPGVIKMMPSNRVFDITDLIFLMKKKRKKIGVFPVSANDWVDVGQWSEYREAVEKFK